MAPFLRSQRAKPLLLLSIIAMLLLAACGGSSSSGTTSGGTPSNSSITLKVGGKLDTEAQLLTKNYVLLLRKTGFNRIEKSPFGNKAGVISPINRGQIELYPEFNAT